MIPMMELERLKLQLDHQKHKDAMELKRLELQQTRDIHTQRGDGLAANITRLTDALERRRASSNNNGPPAA